MARQKITNAEEPDWSDLLKGIIILQKEVKKIKQGLMVERKMAYTNQDVMDMFDIGTKTLKKWRDLGLLGYSQVGSIYLYSRKDISDFLKRNHFKVFEDDRAFKQIVNNSQ